MPDKWQHQLRVYLADAVADQVRAGNSDPRLAEILRRHDATLVSQLDAFEAYVAEAERDGPDSYPLYRWTRATIDDPAKRAKHKLAFAVRVGGREVYPRDAADALEADLNPLIGSEIIRLSRHDTNPADDLPVPAEYRS